MVEIKRRQRMGKRTNAAVAKWLEEQEWYESWTDNMILQSDKTEEIRAYICGEAGPNTLSHSFCWWLSPEGDEYWRGINQQFQEWYYGDD